MKPIRVLIVEDSAVVREQLRCLISADPRLEVADAVGSAEEALAALDTLAPDVISMDILLPGMQGLEATREIMARRPTPIVVVSALDARETNLTMEALRAGALSVVEKPPASTHPEFAELAGRVCTQLAIMSEVVVVRQRQPVVRPAAANPPCAEAGAFRLLGLAASTGGPNALMQVLAGLGAGFPLPVLVVQHMEPHFMAGFGGWLRSVTPFRVEIVESRTKLTPETVYLAAADRHLATDGCWAWPEDGRRVSNQRPSATVMFASMARAVGRGALGVVLTGMGDDGARGLKEIRQAGGYTMAEHESSAVVYGMPAAAVQCGAACESVPLGEIAPRLLRLASGGRKD